MKKIIKPANREEAVYYSDFSGTCFKGDAEAELKLEFNYGSAFDGAVLKFHLTDNEALEVVEFLKTKFSKDCINELKTKVREINNQYAESVEFRDWGNCEHLVCSKQLLEKLIDNPKETS